MDVINKSKESYSALDFVCRKAYIWRKFIICLNYASSDLAPEFDNPYILRLVPCSFG